MVCAQCGGLLEAETRFCARCGAPVVTWATPVGGVGGGAFSGAGVGPAGGAFGGPDPRFAPSVAPGYGAGRWAGMRDGTRVQRNLRTLGVLWCCFGVYRLVAGLVALVFFRTFAMGGGRLGHGFPFGSGFDWPQAPPWLGSLLPVLVTGIVLSASLAILTGVALLNRASWARVLAILAGVLALMKFPLGTALGVYTLYVLAPRASGAEWDEVIASRPVN